MTMNDRMSKKTKNLLKGAESIRGSTDKSIFEKSKNQLAEICDYLLTTTNSGKKSVVSSYSPQKAVELITKYVNSNDSLNRILYSEISNYIFSLDPENQGVLITNLEKLLIYSFELNNKVPDEIKKIVIKIYDHANLACLQKLNAQQVMAKNIDVAKAEINSEVKNISKDNITILGIFASIIIAFVGGITFSTSVLETMASVNIFRLILTIDLLAFVLINTIFMLLKFLMIMSNKDIKELKSVWVGLNVTIAIIAVLVSVSCVIALYINPDFFNEFTSYVYQSQNSEMLHDK